MPTLPTQNLSFDKAKDKDKDLVLVGDQAKPPVCKIIDNVAESPKSIKILRLYISY
ncbi:MAG: hypothetical protein AAFO04_14150 [Cyanobacteria bacterium J06592_8]